MKATLTTRKQKFTTSQRREKAGLFKSYLAVTPDGGKVVDVRLYFPGTVCYCALWLAPSDKSSEDWRSGTGQAGGYGYDKPSAAVGDALRNAGVDLSKRIDGVGESAILEAVAAVAKAMGHRKFNVISVYP